MRILYINHYAGSPKYGMEFRPYYLAKEWNNAGHKITIVGASYSHLRTLQPHIENELSAELIDNINYCWLKTPKYNNSGIRRIINILIFVFKLFFFGRKLQEKYKPDVVIASSTYPLDIFPAYFISKLSKGKLIFELHDMWPMSPMLIGGYSKYHPFIWIMQQAENFACKKSDGYISMLGNAQSYLIERGLKPGKFEHILNGFSEEIWNDFTEDLPVEHFNSIMQLKKENNLIIGYAGGHAPSNSLDVLIEAANELKHEKIAFVLVGKGPSKKMLIERVKELNLENVYFLSPVDKNSIPALLSHFDIDFIAGIKSELHHFGTAANKLTDYMLSGKPIIFAVDEPNSLVERVGCGIQIAAENKTELVAAIIRLNKMTEPERREMGINGRKYAFNELNYKTLANKYLKAIQRF